MLWSGAMQMLYHSVQLYTIVSIVLNIALINSMSRTLYYTRVLIINAAAVPRVAWRRGRAGRHFEAVLKSARRVMYKLPQKRARHVTCAGPVQPRSAYQGGDVGARASVAHYPKNPRPRPLGTVTMERIYALSPAIRLAWVSCGRGAGTSSSMLVSALSAASPDTTSYFALVSSFAR